MSDDSGPTVPKARSNGQAIASTAKQAAFPRSSYEQGLAAADAMIARGQPFKVLSARQECFAQAYAEGASASEAYRYAYQITDIPSQIGVKAREALLRPQVAQRIRELKAQLEHKLLRDREKTQRYVIDNLQKIVELPGSHHSARVHALQMLGKLSGLFDGTENRANAGPDKRSAAEIERELRDKLASLMGDKAKDIKGLSVIEVDDAQVIANNPLDSGADSLSKNDPEEG